MGTTSKGKPSAVTRAAGRSEGGRAAAGQAPASRARALGLSQLCSPARALHTQLETEVTPREVTRAREPLRSQPLTGGGESLVMAKRPPHQQLWEPLLPPPLGEVGGPSPRGFQVRPLKGGSWQTPCDCKVTPPGFQPPSLGLGWRKGCWPKGRILWPIPADSAPRSASPFSRTLVNFIYFYIL